MKKLEISATEADEITRIHELFKRADWIFQNLSLETRDKCLDFHNAESTLNYTIRWGLQASEDIIKAGAQPNLDINIYGFYKRINQDGNFEAEVISIGKDERGIYHGSCIYYMVSENKRIYDLLEEHMMVSKHDVSGLACHLKNMNIIPNDAEILERDQFEAWQVQVNKGVQIKSELAKPIKNKNTSPSMF